MINQNISIDKADKILKQQTLSLNNILHIHFIPDLSSTITSYLIFPKLNKLLIDKIRLRLDLMYSLSPPYEFRHRLYASKLVKNRISRYVKTIIKRYKSIYEEKLIDIYADSYYIVFPKNINSYEKRTRDIVGSIIYLTNIIGYKI